MDVAQHEVFDTKRERCTKPVREACHLGIELLIIADKTHKELLHAQRQQHINKWRHMNDSAAQAAQANHRRMPKTEAFRSG